MALIESKQSQSHTITKGINIMSTQVNSAYAYRQFIASIATSILDEAIEIEGLDIDAVQDTLYEMAADAAGETEVAIYTHHHLDVIKFSEYASEFISEFGNESAGDILINGGLEGLHTAIAVYCIEADMREWLSINAEDIIDARIAELLQGEEE